jgi:hypothetical protein
MDLRLPDRLPEAPAALAAGSADALDLERVAQRAELVPAADLVLQPLDLVLHELENPAAPHADHVLVVFAAEDRLVECPAVAELVTPEQARPDEVRDRPVNRGARDAMAVAPQGGDQLAGPEVAEVLERVGQDSAPLPGGAEPPIPQPLLEMPVEPTHGGALQ